MSDLEFESYNVTAPMQNTPGMKCIAAVLINQNDTAINLSDYFGKLGTGHYFTLQADFQSGSGSQKIYVAFASNTVKTLVTAEAGAGSGVCWPIPDGTLLPVRVLGGMERSSGVSTGTATGSASAAQTWYSTFVQYNSGIIIHAKIPSFIGSGASPTGWLRVFRSSVGQTQGLEQFAPTGF